MSSSCFTPQSFFARLLSMSHSAEMESAKNNDSMLSNATSSSDDFLFSEANENRCMVIKNAFLYAADMANTVIKNAWVIVNLGKIYALGNMDDYDKDWEKKADKVIDASGKMLLPGFVNPHWHESFVAPNMEQADDSDLHPTPYSNGGDVAALGSMFGFISTVGKKLSVEEGRAIARWSMWTQLRSGSTALGDLGSANNADGMALAAIDLGIRLRVSRWGSDIMIPADGKEFKRIADTQEQVDDWLDLMEKWNDHASGLVGGMPSVTGAFGSSDEQLLALGEIAQRFSAPYATHLAPLKNERERVEKVFGCSPIQRLDRLGLLSDRLLAVHTAYASEEEFKRLVESRVNICHSPAHYGMLGESTNSETKQIARFLKEGVWVSTSTDGDITFTGGMAEAMRGAHLNHNEANNCNTTCPPTLALKTGTLFGAKALGWLNKIGSLEIGKDADIVLIDIDDYRYKLSHHPLRTFMVTGNSKDVDTVIIRGNILVENGKSTRFDEDELYADYLRAAESARKRIGPPS